MTAAPPVRTAALAGRSGKKEATRSLPPASPESIAKQRRSNARLEAHVAGWNRALLWLEGWTR